MSYIGQTQPQAPVAPNSVEEEALNVDALQVAGVLPTAWCYFDGVTIGTNAPISGDNVTSITRNSIGYYTATFTVAMDNTDYAVIGSVNSGSNKTITFHTRTTTTIDMYVKDGDSSTDFDLNGAFAIYGGKV